MTTSPSSYRYADGTVMSPFDPIGVGAEKSKDIKINGSIKER